MAFHHKPLPTWGKMAAAEVTFNDRGVILVHQESVSSSGSVAEPENVPRRRRSIHGGVIQNLDLGDLVGWQQERNTSRNECPERCCAAR